MHLTEVFQIVDVEVVTAQVQKAINKHRAVTVRQNKTVTISPIWVFWIVLEVVVPENFSDISHSHWGAGVAGFGFLYGIHAECADSVR